MNLESLANELLVDLFEYLNGIHLFRAFHGLNSRFNNLLLTYFRFYAFDFRSVSKTDFDIICQEHLAPLADRIMSLCLSDDDETPQQLNCFLSHKFILRQFTQLKSLTLNYIRLKEMMDKMMHEVHYLSHLTHMNIIDCYFRSGYFGTIWLLPKLMDFKLQKMGLIDLRNAPKLFSLSLRNVTILAKIDQLTSLEHLFKCTPYLRRLLVCLTVDYHSDQLSFIASSIKILNLSYESSLDKFDDLMRHLPNLSQLTVKTKYIQLDGYQWENIITDYLLKLKRFQMMMEFDINSKIEKENQVDQILDSFRTSFWLVERQWFVRCHWDPLQNNKNYCLCTLPCSFERYFYYATTPFKSTCPDKDDYPSYMSNASQFSNIHHLDLTLPCLDTFWLVIPELHRLTSISVHASNDDSVQSQLQRLLNQASHLYSLKIHSRQSTPYILLADITSQSIRRLDLRSNHVCFNEETCIQLSSTPLGIQCEVLLIQVESRTNILSLINNMKNLRALYIHCKDCVQKSEDYRNPLLLVDELIKWLEERLPTTFAISTDDYFTTCIRLWIRY